MVGKREIHHKKQILSGEFIEIKGVGREKRKRKGERQRNREMQRKEKEREAGTFAILSGVMQG